MDTQRLKQLNEMFAEFGRCEDGTPKFCYKRTEDLPIFSETGLEEAASEPGLVIVGMQKTYRKHSYADIYGPRWCVARWVPPVPEGRWRAAFGDSAPYPKNGEFHPIENLMLDPGRDPNRDQTTIFVLAIRSHMARTAQQWKDAIQHTLDSDKAEKVRQIGDEIDDMQNAFMNPEPGKRGGSVSFGGI